MWTFSAGPGILPQPVLQQAQADLLDYEQTGLSVMEMSHRSSAFTSISDKAETDIRALLSIPDNYKVFWFQGGATLQMASICYNLTKAGETANYITSGSWSQTAIKEGSKFVKATEAANNKSIKYASIADPADWNIDPKARFFHYCMNETIQGFQFHDFPYDAVPEGQHLVSDMSSSFTAGPIDWSKHAVVYAGAQKNLGPAGATVTVVREDLLGNPRPDTPLLCDWTIYSKAPNTFQNTPCTWAIYMAGLNLAHMRKIGLPELTAQAKRKSSLLYDYIDNSNGYYSNGVESKYRSHTNVPFRVKADADLEKKFIEEAA